MSGHKQNIKAEFQTCKVVDMVKPNSRSPNIEGDPGNIWVTDEMRRAFIEVNT